MVGTTLLLTQTRTEPAALRQYQAAVGGRPALFLPGVGGIAAIFVLVGGVFGTFEVTTVAFAREAGRPRCAGLVLALYSFGSLSGGLVFGALTLKASLVRQYVTAACVLGDRHPAAAVPRLHLGRSASARWSPASRSPRC